MKLVQAVISKATDVDKIEKEFTKEISDFLDDVVDFVYERSQENIVANNSFGVTGNLYGKVTVDKKRPFEKHLIYEAPYAEEVEYGTLPHFVPPEVLEEWCRKKYGLTREAAERAAYFVSKKIAEVGIKEKPFLRPAMNEAQVRFLNKAKL